MSRLGQLIALLGALSILADSRAAAPNPEGERFFTGKVQPILAEHCHSCHSHNADKIKGGLVLDSLSGFLTGGDSGPAIVRGEPDKSLLITAIGYADEDLQMPPKGKQLSEDQIRTLTQWVKMGAPWPGSETNKALTRGKITNEDRTWWSFQPLRKVSPPEVKDGGWGRNEIDRFIYAKLDAEGLRPSPEASRQTLVRRL